jgi:hypothetical protein
LANQLLQTYDGSAIVTDTQQDLIGEKYLEEQIKRAHDYQKKNSVIERYSHLLYEGDKDYKSNAKDDLKVYASSSSFANLKPVQQQEYTLQQTKLAPTASGLMQSSSRLVPSGSRFLASGVNLQPSQSQIQPKQQPQQQQQQQQQQQVQQASRQESRQSSSSQLAALQEQIRRLQEEKSALERAQSQVLMKDRQEQQERLARERVQHERSTQEKARQDHVEQEQLKQQIETLLAQQRASQQQQQGSKLSSSSSLNASNLKSVTIDAYNDPQFKALLDQISKPLNAPVENVDLPAQWPSLGSLGKLFSFLFF